METEVYVFTCPSCGGKIDFNKEKNVWECSYCHKFFQTVFASEEQIPIKDVEEQIIYYHHCSKCNKEFTSFTEKDAGCIYCGEKNNAYNSISASAFLKPTMDYENISIYYNEKEIKNCPKEYKEEYLKNNWYLEYVNSDLLNGILELKHNKKTKRYIFVNLIVPNLDYEDYRFMYEIGNSGLKQKTKESDYGIVLLETASQYQQYIKRKTGSHYEGIINACIDTFQKENHISDRNSIEVNNNMKVRTGYYIPVYYKISNINNNNYYQHVLANRDFFKTTFIQYPYINNSLKKSKLCDNIMKLCIVLFFLSIAFIFGYGVLQEVKTNLIEYLKPYYPYAWLALPISAMLALIFYRKADYYNSCTIISKEKYYEEIVNNSNYVKVIGGRK